MKIKDLKEPYRAMALSNQVKQGNKADDDINVDANASEGGFDWLDSYEMGGFWGKVYFKKSPKITDEIKSHHPEIFPPEDPTKKIVWGLFWDSDEKLATKRILLHDLGDKCPDRYIVVCCGDEEKYISGTYFNWTSHEYMKPIPPVTKLSKQEAQDKLNELTNDKYEII